MKRISASLNMNEKESSFSLTQEDNINTGLDELSLLFVDENESHNNLTRDDSNLLNDRTTHDKKKFKQQQSSRRSRHEIRIPLLMEEFVNDTLSQPHEQTSSTHDGKKRKPKPERKKQQRQHHQRTLSEEIVIENEKEIFVLEPYSTLDYYGKINTAGTQHEALQFQVSIEMPQKPLESLRRSSSIVSNSNEPHHVSSHSSSLLLSHSTSTLAKESNNDLSSPHYTQTKESITTTTTTTTTAIVTDTPSIREESEIRLATANSDTLNPFAPNATNNTNITNNINNINNTTKSDDNEQANVQRLLRSSIPPLTTITTTTTPSKTGLNNSSNVKQIQTHGVWFHKFKYLFTPHREEWSEPFSIDAVGDFLIKFHDPTTHKSPSK
jgi:hypothetical protein